jgi:hypothetical protein
MTPLLRDLNVSLHCGPMNLWMAIVVNLLLSKVEGAFFKGKVIKTDFERRKID